MNKQELAREYSEKFMLDCYGVTVRDKEALRREAQENFSRIPSLGDNMNDADSRGTELLGLPEIRRISEME